jgi:hypothetical protein
MAKVIKVNIPVTYLKVQNLEIVQAKTKLSGHIQKSPIAKANVNKVHCK